MRERVRVIPETGVAKDQSSVSIVLRNGRVLTADVDHARGTAGRPVDDVTLNEKFLSLAEPTLAARAQSLLKKSWVLDSCRDVRQLVRLTTPRRPRPSP